MLPKGISLQSLNSVSSDSGGYVNIIPRYNMVGGEVKLSNFGRVIFFCSSELHTKFPKPELNPIWEGEERETEEKDRENNAENSGHYVQPITPKVCTRTMRRPKLPFK